MDSANDFFKELVSGASEGINSATIGKIERFDVEQMKADVLPLVNNQDGREGSLLIEVPVMHVKVEDFYIRTPYKKGDIVLVIFADREIDNVMLTGSAQTPTSQRQHSLDNAVIIGAVRTYEKLTYTPENDEDILISNEDDDFRIILKPKGEIEVQTDKKIKLKNKEEDFFEVVIEENGEMKIRSEQNITFDSDKKIALNGLGGVAINGSSRSESW